MDESKLFPSQSGEEVMLI